MIARKLESLVDHLEGLLEHGGECAKDIALIAVANLRVEVERVKFLEEYAILPEIPENNLDAEVKHG